MASSTISEFKSQLRRGGARPNLFEVDITSATGWVNNDAQTEFKFLCKATSMPTQTIGSVDVPFRGRILKVAGDRTFEPWSITVINDTDFVIRNAFERWSNLMNKHEDNSGLTDPTSYQQDLYVRQLGRSGLTGSNPSSDSQLPVLKQYRFYGAFPTTVSAIDLSYENTDAIEEFTVELQYQWYDALDSSGSSQLGTGG